MKKLLDKVKSGGTIGSVVGEPAGAKERGLVVRAMLTHSDAQRLARLTRAVSVATPVFAYICRYSLEISTNASRARNEVQRERALMRRTL